MVARAYGKSLSDDEIEDVYAAAWAATLSALRTRGDEMTDKELRAYVLTAVASHASKELRRRSRKPATAFDDAQQQVISDSHAPLPEEVAIGSESQGIARDLLSSLPARRRAVMLLRYGWGLSPKEVCALVSGLSPRAYRKEVTRGVEQLIERLKQVESGEWCESREPLLRDYVAGTADEDAERQVRRHLEHCRACSVFTAQLTGHLHELGGLVALSTAAGTIGDRKLPMLDRMVDVIESARGNASAAVEKGQSALSPLAASGGARGSGAVGAGALAKFAGLGGAGKALLACIGAGAAASACVVAGVVPGVSLDDLDSGPSEKQGTPHLRRHSTPERVSAPVPTETGVVAVTSGVSTSEEAVPAAGEGGHDLAPEQSTQAPSSESDDPDSVQQEFDPLAAPTSESTTVSPPPAATAVSGGSGATAAGDEFGP